MTDTPAAPDRQPSSGLDTSVPHSARIWNYWMGGKDNYGIDREVGDQFSAIYPGIIDMARVSRYFLHRVVNYLAGEAGVRQFLDVGTGLPSGDNTHAVAQQIAPESRIVYVDNDPLVLTHARALLTSTPEGLTQYIHADLYEPDKILTEAAKILDFTQPVAIMLMGILGHISIPDDKDEIARSLVGRFKTALPPGGYLAIYDGTNTSQAYVEAINLYNSGGSIPYHLRSPEQVTRLFEGLELVEPGVVQIQQWRPNSQPFGTVEVDAWGGVGRKPGTAMS